MTNISVRWCKINPVLRYEYDQNEFDCSGNIPAIAESKSVIFLRCLMKIETL